MWDFFIGENWMVNLIWLQADLVRDDDYDNEFLKCKATGSTTPEELYFQHTIRKQNGFIHSRR